jgi:glycosyltransferase involved in cell wall biosynthesis
MAMEPQHPLQLSIVAPIYNEAATVPALCERLGAAARQVVGDSYEIILVNDGSRDHSLEALRTAARNDAHVRFFSLSRNFGHQIAVSAGLDHSRGRAVVIIDGDLQDPPEVIPELWAKYREGFKVVYAKRRRRDGETYFKLFTAKLFYRLLKRITSVEIPLDTGDFRLIDRVVVDALNQMPERHKFLRGQISWIGFRQSYVEYDRHARVAGATGYTLSKMLKFAVDGITAFSTYPLKVATWAGFLVSGLAFMLIVYALVSKFVWHEAVEGWPSLMISSMFIGGVQLLSIGIIGEYIGRINDDVKRRPLYFLEESSDGKG